MIRHVSTLVFGMVGFSILASSSVLAQCGKGGGGGSKQSQRSGGKSSSSSCQQKGQRTNTMLQQGLQQRPQLQQGLQQRPQLQQGLRQQPPMLLQQGLQQPQQPLLLQQGLQQQPRMQQVIQQPQLDLPNLLQLATQQSDAVLEKALDNSRNANVREAARQELTRRGMITSIREMPNPFNLAIAPR